MAEAAPSVFVLPEEKAAVAFEPDALLRLLAHELSQPLSAVESIAYYLEMALPEEASGLRPHLNKLALLVEVANAMLRDAVHCVRPTSGNPQLLDIHQLLQAELSSWTDADAWCTVGTDDAPARVLIDRVQAPRLLRNLIVTARRLLAPPAQFLHLREWRDSGEWILQLRIPGRDHSRQQLRDLFDPFAPQLAPGCGLALTAARRIAEAHGGSLDASPGDGGGLLLTLRLPLET
jgi:signal transduction histidine kinase